MDILTESEFRLDFDRFSRLLKVRPLIFIYPTDTIYGIGCSVDSDLAVKKIRELKNRPESPMSIIVPSKEWIREHCEVGKEEEKYLEKLPGPYTIILKVKKRDFSEHVNNGIGTIGVRMPDHWISYFVSHYGRPIITTSANKTGGNFMTCLDDLDRDMRNNVDFIVNSGTIEGSPSNIINLAEGEAREIRR